MASREELHAKLDAQCDARRHEWEAKLAALEEDRERGHEWIDSAPEAVLEAIAGYGIEILDSRVVTLPVPPKIQLYEPIKHLIRSLDPDREVTSAIVYDALSQTIPELKFEDQRKLKARIAGTLTRLADEKILKIWKSGSGSAPHTYKIMPKGYVSVMDALNDGAEIHK